MKNIVSFLSIFVISVSGLFFQVSKANAKMFVERVLSGTFSQNQNRNSITGFVFNESRTPIGEVYVELLSDTYSTISRTKTNGAGFYSFKGIPNGNFKVKILPYGTNYEGQLRDVALVSISAVAGRGSVSEQVDFYLKVRKNANAGPLAAPGVIFAQEVPRAAQKLYEEGINYLRDKKEKEGFEKLKSAIEIFPEYYLALDRLGTEYVMRGYHRPAFVLLTKAVEINPRSFSSTFGLGLAQYRLQQFDLAVENLQRATTLHNESINAYLWLGIALHQNKKLTQAETALIKAHKLSKGESAEVHWQLARLYSEQKRYREAADELEIFIKNNPQPGETEKVKETIKQLRQKATAQ
ncbi:MAG: tetratricopeptide repeat protein [Acidobacteria bacterium]|nr:tetratricopeptide repeat protein [Acidobacteriota bacterium]MCA1639124.1 tetratricopeptide repeat protein [Acidobacteriota bacterium]